MNTYSFTFNFTDSFTGCDGEGNYWSCCSSSNPCGVAEGDCDYDDDCLGHLLCGTDNCLSPFSSTADCCYDEELLRSKKKSIFFYFCNLTNNKKKKRKQFKSKIL